MSELIDPRITGATYRTAMAVIAVLLLVSAALGALSVDGGIVLAAAATVATISRVWTVRQIRRGADPWRR